MKLPSKIERIFREEGKTTTAARSHLETPEERLGRLQKRLQYLEAKLEEYKVAKQDSDGYVKVDLKTTRKFTKQEVIQDVEEAIRMVKEEIEEVKPKTRILSRF